MEKLENNTDISMKSSAYWEAVLKMERKWDGIGS